MVELWRLLYVFHLVIVGFDCGGKKILLWGWFEGFIEKREVVGWLEILYHANSFSTLEGSLIFLTPKLIHFYHIDFHGGYIS